MLRSCWFTVCVMLLLSACSEQIIDLTPPPDPPPAQGDLAAVMREAHTVTESFAQSIRGLSTTADARDSIMTLIESGDDFVRWLQELEQASQAQALQLQQSVDPLLVRDVGNIIGDTRQQAQACDAINDILDREDCFRRLRQQKLQDTSRLGVAAVVGGGAAVIVGGAAAAAGAPVLITVGAAAAVGGAVSWFVSWCTSGSNALLAANIDAQDALATCNMVAGQGQAGQAVAVPYQGSGTMVLHLDGQAPVVLDVDLLEGKEIRIDGNPPRVSIVDAPIVGCDAIVGLNVQPNPSNPAPGQDVMVTVSTTPAAVGCAVSYSVVGTDDYRDSGSVQTDANGQIRFGVPGAEGGVADVINVSAANGVRATASYVF